MPDFIIVSGDTEPQFTDQLEYSTGEKVNLEGATVQFIMRSATSPEPVKLTGATSIPAPKEGKVAFAPTAADTTTVGDFMGAWKVTFGGGEVQTFPTDGWLWVRVEPNLTSSMAGQIVGLPEVLDYLNLPADDRIHDVKLLGHIKAVGSLIEEEIGPVVPTVYDEWFNGGHATIALPHKPSTGYGVKPILRLLAASEYRGPVEYDLAITATPSEGQIFSVMVDVTHGVVVRRTAGGGVMPFPFDPEHGDQQVHLVYEAGLEEVPENVKMAAKEAIRINYTTTQSVGRGRRTVTDEEEPGVSLGFYLPGRCKELLSPNRRFPSLA
jgi:hypothetical protein